MPGIDNRDVRPEVVDALWDATTRECSDEHLAELLWNATPAERRAVADMHYEASLHYVRRAQAMRYAMVTLQPHWYRAGQPMATFTIGNALKIAPREVADDILEQLYFSGWTKDEIGFPRPGRD